MPSPWTIEELCDALASGKLLSNESPEDPPWPKYLDDEYRRITAAMNLALYFSYSPKAIDALSNYFLTGKNEEVRVTCVKELGKISKVAHLIPQLVNDPEPELRLYALEFILIECPEKLTEIAPCIRKDSSWEILETLECLDTNQPIPLFYYEMPANE